MNELKTLWNNPKIHALLGVLMMWASTAWPQYAGVLQALGGFFGGAALQTPHPTA